MEKQYALRIYKDENTLLTVVTTRTGLVVNDATGEVTYPVKKLEKQKDDKVLEVAKDGLKLFAGKKFVLYDITAQKEVITGTVNGKINFIPVIEVKGETSNVKGS